MIPKASQLMEHLITPCFLGTMSFLFEWQTRLLNGSASVYACACDCMPKAGFTSTLHAKVHPVPCLRENLDAAMIPCYKGDSW
jgi:hypothetical protein